MAGPANEISDKQLVVSVLRESRWAHTSRTVVPVRRRRDREEVTTFREQMRNV